MVRYRWELALRILPAAGLCWFLFNIVRSWDYLPAPVAILLVIGECLTVAIYLAARPAREAGFGPIALLSTFCATYYFAFIVLDQGNPIVPLALAVVFQAFGIALQIWAKWSLGRSFGMLPANRGIVTRGPYQWLRHPIYSPYFVGHVGFMLANWSTRNLLLFASLYFFQCIRVSEEEKVLRRDPAYRAYCQRVPWRLIPGVF